MTITSTAFQNNEPIPAEYSYDGKNVNPPLTFSEVPVEAKSLALIVEDPDAPNGTFTHWVLYNMSPATLQILEDQIPSPARQGKTGFGAPHWGGPKPPSGTHRYFFKLFALDKMLDLPETAGAPEVYKAMEGHILDQAQIVGLFAAK